MAATVEELFSDDLQRRNESLMELRQLQQVGAPDAAVREQLAQSLFNALIDAKKENDLQRRDALLVELRQLQQTWQQDATTAKTLDDSPIIMVRIWMCR